mmetsp:Transcript_56671/g.137751  ORF Transcript_56671/g.137751 Transcript_56671/m.137751 type:complete len:81 (-) Transcript_56671:1111-1353(-)
MVNLLGDFSDYVGTGTQFCKGIIIKVPNVLRSEADIARMVDAVWWCNQDIQVVAEEIDVIFDILGGKVGSSARRCGTGIS